MDTTQIALFAILVVLSVGGVIVTYRKKSSLELVKEIENQVLYLFLFAEKEGWVDEEKMAWSVRMIYEKIAPDKLEKILSGQKVEDWAQNLYNRFKSWIKENASESKLTT